MKNSSKISMGIAVGLIVGALGMYFFMSRNSVQKVSERNMVNQNRSESRLMKPLTRKDFDSFFDHSFNDEFFKTDLTPFKQMEKMRKNMDQLFNNQFKNYDSDLYFDNWFEGKFGGSVFDVEQAEDDDFVYYKIKAEGIDKNNLSVVVENGYLKISGKIEKTNESSAEDTSSKSHYSSQFARSFPVPNGVDADKVKIETSNQEIIVKFPQVKS